jgi:electron transfer flavoprotein alpha subunit
MKEILVVAEHRMGEMREITWEMIAKGRQLAKDLGGEIQVALLGKEVGHFAESLKSGAHQVFLVEDDRLDVFNSETYQKVLAGLLAERKPFLTLIGHTGMGMDLAPSLAASLQIPLATDCTAVDLEGEALSLTRQLYAGKMNARVSFRKPGPYLATIRPGAFSASEKDFVEGRITPLPSALTDEVLSKRFLQYVEAAAGDVDITQADILVSVGRGIKDPENLPIVRELADALGATLSCSRPVVDKKWLPKACQVGTSGKTVKPKVYIALGISGAFQHMAGMKGAGTIIAVNKDPKAPIFSFAHYGIVGDLFKIVPVLREKVKGLKQR